MNAFMVFFLTLLEILKICGPALLILLVVLALACYGFQMIRLFFKF